MGGKGDASEMNGNGISSTEQKEALAPGALLELCHINCSTIPWFCSEVLPDRRTTHSTRRSSRSQGTHDFRYCIPHFVSGKFGAFNQGWARAKGPPHRCTYFNHRYLGDEGGIVVSFCTAAARP